MKSLILTTATKILLPILLIFSLFILVRGHNEPGGGFVGGLVASMAYALYSFSNGVAQAKKIFPLKPNFFLIIGLLITLTSGLPSLLLGKAAFTGLWFDFKIPIISHLGTPFIFDIGVYCLVFGATTGIIFTLKSSE